MENLSNLKMVFKRCAHLKDVARFGSLPPLIYLFIQLCEQDNTKLLLFSVSANYLQ